METLLLSDPRLADPAGAYAQLRREVVDRLVVAQTLLPPAFRLLVTEGYRPAALQVRYFSACLARMRAEAPDLDEAAGYGMASRWVSPPEVAPHVAGAAVDLTLCTVDGAELWLGTEVNDTDMPACYTASDLVNEEARRNRRVLGAALTAAGLVNYPSEWWRWSYGNRYWAFVTVAAYARYGPADF